MTDQPEVAATPDQPVWVRSAQFQAVKSDTFRYRIALGDVTVVFCTMGDVPGSATANVVEEKFAVSLTWPQLKALAFVATETVAAIEEKFGAIPMLRNGGFNLPIRLQASLALSQLDATQEIIGPGGGPPAPIADSKSN